MFNFIENTAEAIADFVYSIPERIGKGLCKIHRHSWHFMKGTDEQIGYDKWGRTYQMQGQFYCDRYCGVDDKTMYWEDNGMGNGPKV